MKTFSYWRLPGADCLLIASFDKALIMETVTTDQLHPDTGVSVFFLLLPLQASNLTKLTKDIGPGVEPTKTLLMNREYIPLP